MVYRRRGYRKFARSGRRRPARRHTRYSGRKTRRFGRKRFSRRRPVNLTPGRTVTKTFTHTYSWNLSLSNQVGQDRVYLASTSFQLSAHPEAAAFSSSYDRYRIRRITQTIRPPWGGKGTMQEYFGAAASNRPAPFDFMYIVDRDDDDAPSSWNYLRARGGRVQSGGRTMKSTISWPSMHTVGWCGPTMSVLNNFHVYVPRGTWLDCRNKSLVHYGWKYGFRAPAAFASAENPMTLVLTVDVTFVVDFKDQLIQTTAGETAASTLPGANVDGPLMAGEDDDPRDEPLEGGPVEP